MPAMTTTPHAPIVTLEGLRHGLLALALAELAAAGPLAAADPLPAPLAAEVRVALDQPGDPVNPLLWGSNLMGNIPAADTVDNPAFVEAARLMGIRILRWPGGNEADIYDWKHNLLIKPGRRVPQEGNVTLLKAAAFAEAIGAELSITVNFGTMSARDAADLVEFCNGPTNTFWGAERARQGHPEPLDVRWWEIGNEENQPHMWHYSWTAENPLKYFLGGDEERRGQHAWTPQEPHRQKGDVFTADGGPGQLYWVRFTPARDPLLRIAPDRQAAEEQQFEVWNRVDSLETQGPEARVYTFDDTEGAIRFGDGVHGAMPPDGAVVWVEYTTVDHDGFVAFAEAMKAVPSSVPISIGAATLPFVEGEPLDLTEEQMNAILDAIDFHVNHKYGASFPATTYAARRQIAWERTQPGVHGRFEAWLRDLGRERIPAIGVTEWNIFLDDPQWFLNRTLEAGVIAAEYFVRVINAGPELPVALAHQFALHGGALSLYHDRNHSICPMGWVFVGFASWTEQARELPVAIDSPTAVAFDEDLPFLQAAAAWDEPAGLIRLALVNNAETNELDVRVTFTGAPPPYADGRLWRLTADKPTAANEQNPDNVVLEEEPWPAPADGHWTLRMPPFSVAFA
ncbi:MAG: hypothetical protein D6766_11830, partial [Verrucomicrobia bacterium]